VFVFAEDEMSEHAYELVESQDSTSADDADQHD